MLYVNYISIKLETKNYINFVWQIYLHKEIPYKISPQVVNIKFYI